jgi:hypothetical protein
MLQTIHTILCETMGRLAGMLLCWVMTYSLRGVG